MTLSELAAGKEGAADFVHSIRGELGAEAAVKEDFERTRDRTCAFGLGDRRSCWRSVGLIGDCERGEFAPFPGGCFAFNAPYRFLLAVVFALLLILAFGLKGSD